jgi:hypothetical protein
MGPSANEEMLREKHSTNEDTSPQKISELVYANEEYLQRGMEAGLQALGITVVWSVS